MLDIKFIRENPDAVKENIKKKFQEQKLPLVDQVLELDAENRRTIQEAQELRTARNAKSKQVGVLMGQSKKDPSKLAEAEALKAEVKADADRLAFLEGRETELAAEIRHPAPDPQHHRSLRAHRPRRLLQRGGATLRRGSNPRL